MFQVLCKIMFNQQPSKYFPTRDKTLVFKSVIGYEANNGWEDLTDQAKITLSKTIAQFKAGDVDIGPFHLRNEHVNIGGFSNIPTFLRGDKVSIESGYYYKQDDRYITDTANVFDGYISGVKGNKTFQIEAEDNMWLLKQTPAVGGVNGVFSHKTYSVESMLAELILNRGLPFTVNALTSTDLPFDFQINHCTIGQILERLRKLIYLKSYFRGNELRCGSLVYTVDDFHTYNFDFQKNIIESDLTYTRKDDIVLSAIGRSTNTSLTGKTTRDGHAKTKSECLEVLVTFQNGTITSIVKQPGSTQNFPTNDNGERHDVIFNNITDSQELIRRTTEQLVRYYYTGYRGTFTTFGIPFVRFGDDVKFNDNDLPERNGTYKVKKVEYKLSVEGGLRQVIHLDFKISNNERHDIS